MLFKDEIDALQIIYNQPYGQEELTFEQIKELAGAIERPPYQIAPDRLWKAYERLDGSESSRADVQLTDIISILRYELDQIDELKPFEETVEERFDSWLENQKSEFSETELEWLEMIKDEIAKNAHVE
jgi:type I restriction enzyme R subunit